MLTEVRWDEVGKEYGLCKAEKKGWIDRVVCTEGDFLANLLRVFYFRWSCAFMKAKR